LIPFAVREAAEVVVVQVVVGHAPLAQPGGRPQPSLRFRVGDASLGSERVDRRRATAELLDQGVRHARDFERLVLAADAVTQLLQVVSQAVVVDRLVVWAGLYPVSR